MESHGKWRHERPRVLRRTITKPDVPRAVKETKVEQNCKLYDKGACLHPFAPRPWFGASRCILNVWSKDPRIIRGCALQAPLDIPVRTRPPGASQRT